MCPAAETCLAFGKDDGQAVVCARRLCQGHCVCPSAVSRMSRLAQGCVPCRSSMHTTSHACSTTTGGIVRVHMLRLTYASYSRTHSYAAQTCDTSMPYHLLCVCDMHTTQQMYIKNTWFVSTLRVCVYEARYFLFSSLTYHLHVSYRSTMRLGASLN